MGNIVGLKKQRIDYILASLAFYLKTSQYIGEATKNTLFFASKDSPIVGSIEAYGGPAGLFRTIADLHKYYTSLQSGSVLGMVSMNKLEDAYVRGIQEHPNYSTGTVAFFIFDLREQEENIQEVLDFLSAVQIFKSSLSRHGYDVGFLVVVDLNKKLMDAIGDDYGRYLGSFMNFVEVE